MHLFLLKGLLNEPSAIQRFCKEYIVNDHLVKNYDCHLEDLQLKKKKREESRKRLQREERSKTYDDYDWILMYREGRLRKLEVSSLDLYLDKHAISCSRSTLKQEKVDIVAAHIARSLVETDVIDNEEDDVEDEESDEEYEDDVVLEEIGDDSDKDESIDAEEQSEIDDDDSVGDDNSDEDNNDYDDNDDYDKNDDIDDHDNDNGDNEEVQISDILCTTKSGRTCRTWKGRYLYF